MAKGREVYAKPPPATRQTACLSVGPFRQADCCLLALSAKMTIDLYQKYNNRQEPGRAMKPLSIILSLVFAALTLVSAPSFASQDEGRPRLERYASYDAFLKAMVAWESRQGSITAPAASIPASAPVADSTPSTRPIPLPEGVDPTSETAPPPLAITGPEDLEVAVELAKDISHPDYKAPIRYNRSTHISFPLPSIDGSDMSQASIAGALTTSTSDNTGDAVTFVNQRIELNTTTGADPQDASAPATVAGITLGRQNGPSQVVIRTHN